MQIKEVSFECNKSHQFMYKRKTEKKKLLKIKIKNQKQTNK